MIVNYNVKGAERKALAKAVAEFIGEDLKYSGMPTMNYTVVYYTITPNGVLEFDDMTDTKEVEGLLDFLCERGFCPEKSESKADGETTPAMDKTPQNANLELTSEDTETPRDVITGLTVELPKDMVDINKLENLLKSKGALIKKALGVENINVEATEYTAKFPWFDRTVTSEEEQAYSEFIMAICKMSKELKRINPKSKDSENEKYAFRCFLLRLGFIGEKYKTSRKILLKNLKGSSAFREGEKHETTT